MIRKLDWMGELHKQTYDANICTFNLFRVAQQLYSKAACSLISSSFISNELQEAFRFMACIPSFPSLQSPLFSSHGWPTNPCDIGEQMESVELHMGPSLWQPGLVSYSFHELPRCTESLFLARMLCLFPVRYRKWQWYSCFTEVIDRMEEPLQLYLPYRLRWQTMARRYGQVRCLPLSFVLTAYITGITYSRRGTLNGTAAGFMLPYLCTGHRRWYFRTQMCFPLIWNLAILFPSRTLSTVAIEFRISLA